MGLLDFDDDDSDELIFSNFDAGYTAAIISPHMKALAPTSPSSASTESVLTNESTSTSASTSPSTTPSVPTPRKKSSSSRRRASKSKSLKLSTLTKSISPGFDLYHDDDELQDAEPRIAYCDKCLKHCKIHDTTTS